jgi:hypothetical protein
VFASAERAAASGLNYDIGAAARRCALGLFCAPRSACCSNSLFRDFHTAGFADSATQEPHIRAEYAEHETTHLVRKVEGAFHSFKPSTAEGKGYREEKYSGVAVTTSHEKRCMDASCMHLRMNIVSLCMHA